MPSKAHTIRFDSADLKIIERYRAGRRMSFSAAVKELMYIGDSSIEDRIVGESFKDFIRLSRKIQVEMILLLRHFLHSEHKQIYTKAKAEAKEVLASHSEDN
ncbi:MAG: hypothetical protein KKF24_03070 [Gammaproteobacteria bacterium]|nr:hypothetical protein [Gammaproteobacteria bacterium]MBU1831656.1 hypothetical protein [Gammaproteobacteria bacterium]